MNNQGQCVPKPCMEFNFNRFRTFLYYPLQIPPASLYAKAGFYYSGESDTVTCFECGISISNWKASHDPLDVHKTHSPDCPYISEVIREKSQLVGLKITDQLRYLHKNLLVQETDWQMIRQGFSEGYQEWELKTRRQTLWHNQWHRQIWQKMVSIIFVCFAICRGNNIC